MRRTRRRSSNRRGDSTSTSPAPQSSRSHVESSESTRVAATWCPPEPVVALPKPPPRSLDPKKDAVAVVVATNTYTLAQSGRQVELVRRVVVQSREKTIYDRRVEIRAPTLLNALEVDRTNRDDIAAPLTPYSEVIRELARHLPYCYCVFHDRAKTLAALRLALPIERSFDIGLHVHLRNDALRRGGKNVTRSRHRVVPLEDLWQPILGYSMPSGLRLRADGILRIFARIARSMGPTPQMPSTNTTPQLEWLSRGDVVHELSASLLIEQRAVETTSEASREISLDSDELLPPKKGSAPFRFELQRVVGIDLRRFETVNRLFTLAPHFGLAFLRLLVERDIVPADYPTELANRQRRRLSIARHVARRVLDQHQRAGRRVDRYRRCRHRGLPDVRRHQDRGARGEDRLPGVRGAGDRAPRVTPTRRLAVRRRSSHTNLLVTRIVRRTHSNSTPYSLESYAVLVLELVRRTRIHRRTRIVAFDLITCTRVLVNSIHNEKLARIRSHSHSMSFDSFDSFDASIRFLVDLLCRLHASFRRGRVWQGTRTVPLPSVAPTVRAFISYGRRSVVLSLFSIVVRISKINVEIHRRVHRVTNVYLVNIAQYSEKIREGNLGIILIIVVSA